MNTQITSLESTENEIERNSEDKSEYNYCLRCHRKLKNPEYRLRGMGKICWEKSHIEQSRRLFDANRDT